MDSETLMTVLKVFAPTVSDKIVSAIKDRRMNGRDLTLVLSALVAEQNAKSLDLLEQLCKRTANVETTMKTVDEGVGTLLKRTRS